MFKIVTDPTVYPIREVDLTEAAGGLILTPTGGGTSRDLTWERSDGGLNVARRARRAEFTLEASLVTTEQADALREVIGLTSGGAPRSAAYLFPPFDRSTLASFPFQGSLKGWRRAAWVGTLEEATVGFSRNSVAKYTDKWGRFREVAANVPRFMGNGPLGQAVLIGDGEDNLAPVPHPTSGNLGWTPGAGTPVLEWVLDERSPWLEAGGVMRVRRSTGNSCQLFVTGGVPVSSSASTRLHVSVWIKGNVQGTLQADVGLQTASAGGASSPDGWTRWSLDFQKNDGGTSMGVLLSFNDDAVDRTAYVGPIMVTEYNDDGGAWPAPHWDEGVVAKDDLGVQVANTPGAMTFSVATQIPPPNTRLRYWWLGGPDDSLTLEWDNTARLRWNIGNGPYISLYPPPLTWAGVVGKPAVVTVRLDQENPGSYRARMQVAYLTANNTLARWTQENTGVWVSDYSTATDLTVGSFGAWEPAEYGVSWLRYDGRAWSDLQLEVWERCILDAGFRDVFAVTQGRKFLLGDLELEPVPRTMYQRATLTARETSADTDLAVVT